MGVGNGTRALLRSESVRTLVMQEHGAYVAIVSSNSFTTLKAFASSIKGIVQGLAERVERLVVPLFADKPVDFDDIPRS